MHQIDHYLKRKMKKSNCKDLVSEKEEIKCSNITKKMINFDDLINEETKEHNPNWPQIPDHPYRISITGGPGSGAN